MTIPFPLSFFAQQSSNHQGNKSFVAFSNLSDSESLTKTWKVCTKVASYLEQGQRLENLSWRLWHLQNLIVDTDNAKSKREFKKLSKVMGDKLDKEKGRSIEELGAPDFKRNASSDLIRQRAAEKERSREASQNAKPGTIKRMQFTFSVDRPTPAGPGVASMPDLKPSAEFKDNASKRGRQAARAPALEEQTSSQSVGEDDASTLRRRKVPNSSFELAHHRFPSSLFTSDFGPSSLLHAASTPMSTEGEDTGSSADGLSVMRPTIELPLDELLSTVDTCDTSHLWPFNFGEQKSDQDIIMHDHSQMHHHVEVLQPVSVIPEESHISTPVAVTHPVTRSAKEGKASKRGSTPGNRPSLTVKTSPATRSSGPSATATSVNPAVLRNNAGTNGNSAPGGVKAECVNCGATHTPLWRRGLNDELNCNACGLYCKLHKRPRPKTMRSNHGEGRTQAAPRQETVDVVGGYKASPSMTPVQTRVASTPAGTAQCYNCHTTATPLWRKDDEGKTVCNACGLYFKLHGSARPISMKSDVIRKRSRHDARRAGPDNASETPSASPGASRRPSPSAERSPTLAPDSTTQPTYEFTEDPEIRNTQSELMNALGSPNSGANGVFSQAFASVFNQFPGPYHPDHLNQTFASPPTDALPFQNVEVLDSDDNNEQRTTKRRRMSTDSASEPPSSAVSYSSYNDSYSSASHSRSSSMDFPFFSSYNIFRGSGNTFWHPPMLSTADRSPPFVHPPMLPADESPMDFLHPPMLPADEENLFSSFLHPHPPMPCHDENGNSNNGGGHGDYGNAASQAEFYDAAAMQTY
ncbi:hypothetical protein CONPUDRAFT_110709 [Coniophora puteana RWD-64-598 SS2]|uniref:GATA-type domain-containing protein n=1 Tax=Coniophora puteana (strain RWD-64-598) TaxID=741705 RepID=A0A5M3MCL2_CONPW|nr:uncharacterized protein CONPUDRAFT_110709 [Coniophora puteana RWD-64-598 SS2]EIW76948.1 hypothetical protein CONPUDRAFT_110709 [Coniophora puteana RWD-64-598 SS2]